MTEDERLSRLLVDSRDVDSKGSYVKARAFAPSRAGETSVCCTSSMREDAIWAWGMEHVEPTRGPVLGRADVRAGDASSLGLSVESDEPPPHHAVIRGWPDEKSKRMQ